MFPYVPNWPKACARPKGDTRQREHQTKDGGGAATAGRTRAVGAAPPGLGVVKGNGIPYQRISSPVILSKPEKNRSLLT